MDRTPLEESLSELKSRVDDAAARLLEYRKREKTSDENRNLVEKRLAGLIKRIGEFSGGK